MPAPVVAEGAPVWVDLLTHDVARACAFYCALFGWTVEPSGGSLTFLRDGASVAGCTSQRSGSDTWLVYLATDDVAAALVAAQGAGAHVELGPEPVGDLGVRAALTDPTAALVGLWQPDRARRLTVVGEPGTPTWFELCTGDVDEALRFYRDVLGWQTCETGASPAARYTMLVSGSHPLAGIVRRASGSGRGAASGWTTYFAVDDVGDTLARCAALGGSVGRRTARTPYGRLATLVDPLGASFSVRGC